MRIVSGKFRGKILASPSHNIRPTLDKVKQALFTKLQFEIPNSTVLDLFSGSGALGIEAISRGAKEVVFCDKNELSIQLTKKNIASIKFDKNETNVEILNCDFLIALEKLKNKKFNLIILDPPYESGLYEKAMEFIFKNKMLDGYLVCERLKEKKIEQNYFALETTKNYGTVSLDYFVNSSL